MSRQRKSFLTPRRIIGLAILVVIIAVLALLLFLGDKNVAVLNPQGIIADKQKTLILFTLGLGLLVVIPVFVLLFSTAWKYREGNKKAIYRPDKGGNRLLEFTWWGIPIIIIAILGVVTWFSSHDLDPYRNIDSDKKPLRVQVVALQWKWLFIYPDLDIASVNEVRFPVDRPVNFEITADAPMSAFWIPNLGSQVYAMNGMMSQLRLEARTVGEYPGSTTNINGKGYSSMRFKAVAVTENDFETWRKTVDVSPNHLDWSHYTQLAEPSEKQPVTYYMVHDATIFDQVMMKYMSSDAMSGEQTDSHDMMNHSMEGM